VAHWFSDAFGFTEPKDFQSARAAFRVREVASDAAPHAAGPALELEAIATQRVFHLGPFEEPSVAELKERVADMSANAPVPAGGLSFTNIVAEARSLHLEPSSANGVFQAASQFNCLEMVGPSVRPEDGVTRYYADRTQGPACAIACPAATVFRNYHVRGRGQAGGSAAQLDLARDAGAVVGNGERGYWQMQNGYLLPDRPCGLGQLAERLGSEEGLAQRVRDSLRVGVHWDTETQRTASQPQQVEGQRVAQALARGCGLAASGCSPPRIHAVAAWRRSASHSRGRTGLRLRTPHPARRPPPRHAHTHAHAHALP